MDDSPLGLHHVRDDSVGQHQEDEVLLLEGEFVILTALPVPLATPYACTQQKKVEFPKMCCKEIDRKSDISGTG